MATLSKFSFQLKRSLTGRLLSGFGVALIAVALATLGVNYHLVRSDLQQQVRRRAQTITQGLEFATEGLIEGGKVESGLIQRVVQNYATLPAVVEVAIINSEGIVLASNSQESVNHLYVSLRPELARVSEEASLQGIEYNLQTVLDRRTVLAQILPFSSTMFGKSGRRGLTIAILDLRQMEQDVWRTFFTSTLTMLAGIIVILIFMWWSIEKNVLLPLKRLNKSVIASKATGVFSLQESIPNNEIKALGDILEGAFKQRANVEKALRDSEAKEFLKAQQLVKALQELKQTQSQLIQGRLASLKQMVAGVAHEINNPIGFIYSNLYHVERYAEDLMRAISIYENSCEKLPPEILDEIGDIDVEFIKEDLPKMLNSMQNGAERVRQIVLSLRSFSRLDEADMKPVNIHDGIDNTLLILQHRLKGDGKHPAIEAIKEYGELPSIACYASEMNQVFMNIISNAIDALEDVRIDERSTIDSKRSPTIRITTELTEINRKSYVSIRIADNGWGIDEDALPRIFDPFFTTKPVGKGTGLGLSISHSIVVDTHKGRLNCVSKLGEGTEFIIEIPVK